jgi:hypothetical protein
MGGRWGVAGALGVGVVVASVLAGCGGGSSGLKLTAYVVHGSQETGFSTQGAPSVIKSLSAYLASQYGGGSDPTKLRAEVFKEFAAVGTGGSQGRQGGSFALELGSPSATSRPLPSPMRGRAREGGSWWRSRFRACPARPE